MLKTMLNTHTKQFVRPLYTLFLGALLLGGCSLLSKGAAGVTKNSTSVTKNSTNVTKNSTNVTKNSTSAPKTPYSKAPPKAVAQDAAMESAVMKVAKDDSWGTKIDFQRA
ncbi:MAG: hypothetical protein JRH20_31060, partial [Deltaproteobacteria bacterium]|nr:hypothetical protein [Deltaproteobacteria bacterium]